MKLIKVLEFLSGVLAGLALFATMVLTFFDVLGRKLLDHSIAGSLEMTELMMVIVIFGALPLVSARGEHIVFDSLDPIWPKCLRNLHLRLVHLVCATALISLGWLMWQTGHDFQVMGETTAQLGIPKSPFIYGMGILCAFTGLIHLMFTLNPSASEENEGGVL
jgi:TRAP-type C4-dicarboxylate transport system permease small subunit